MGDTAAIRPLAIDHVQVNVTDVARSVDFYTRYLGLTVRGDRPDMGVDGAWLDLGDQQVHFVQAAVPPILGQHFSVLVDDLGSAVAALRQRGIDVSEPAPSGRDLQSFMVDPDGNLIELHQRG